MAEPQWSCLELVYVRFLLVTPIHQLGILSLQERYKSYDSGIGAKIERGETSFEQLEVSTN